jgi:hypothetical protein
MGGENKRWFPPAFKRLRSVCLGQEEIDVLCDILREGWLEGV